MFSIGLPSGGLLKRSVGGLDPRKTEVELSTWQVRIPFPDEISDIYIIDM